MGSKIIGIVTSKGGRSMDKEMGSRVTKKIDGNMCMKIRKEDG